MQSDPLPHDQSVSREQRAGRSAAFTVASVLFILACAALIGVWVVSAGWMIFVFALPATALLVGAGVFLRRQGRSALISIACSTLVVGCAAVLAVVMVINMFPASNTLRFVARGEGPMQVSYANDDRAIDETWTTYGEATYQRSGKSALVSVRADPNAADPTVSCELWVNDQLVSTRSEKWLVQCVYDASSLSQ